MTEPLFNNPDFTRFYDAESPWDTDKDYCFALAENAGSVLDLGCGTGELATRLAGTHRVTGVEPAAAMLDHARRRQGADRCAGSRPMPARCVWTRPLTSSS